MPSQHTDRPIPSTQNERENLELLASQRQFYTRAKRFQLVQIILGLPFVGTLSCAAFWLNRPGMAHPIDIAWWVAAVSLAVTLLGTLVLSPLAEAFQETAAKIQELFDTKVLKLGWNSVTVGETPAPESIHRYAERYKKREPDLGSLIDWYSPRIAELPDHIGRIVCQRANLVWDVGLRKRFSSYLVFTDCALFLILFVLGAWDGLSIRLFLLGIAAPSLPMAAFAIEQGRGNAKAAKNLERLTRKLEDALERVAASGGEPNDLYSRARQIQDNIYINRKENPLIFDWFYRHFREPQESGMQYSADYYIRKFKSQLPSSAK